MKLHFILIRHGETVWTKERRFQGQKDTALTPRGRLQVARFKEEIFVYKPNIIFSSALKRSKDSAEILCKPLRIKPKVDSRLNEISFGLWEGKTADELLAESDPSYMRWMKGKSVTPKGGESIPVFNKRVKNFITDCKKRYDNKKIVIVTHGGVIRMFLKELLKLSNKELFKFRIDPGTMTVIGCYTYSSQLILFNSPRAIKGIIPKTCV